MIKKNKKSITWSTSEIAGLILAVIILFSLVYAAVSLYNVLSVKNPSQDVVCIFNKAYIRLNRDLYDVNIDCSKPNDSQLKKYLIILIPSNIKTELIKTDAFKKSENYHLCIYDKTKNQFKKCLLLDKTKLESKYMNLDKLFYLSSQHLPIQDISGSVNAEYLVFEFKELNEKVLNKEFNFNLESNIKYEYRPVCERIDIPCSQKGGIEAMDKLACGEECKDTFHCCLEKVPIKN